MHEEVRLPSSNKNPRELDACLLLRRLAQLAVLHEHCRTVLREGKRPLSGMELWRVQQVSDLCLEQASRMRGLRTDGPDVPDAVAAEMLRKP